MIFMVVGSVYDFSLGLAMCIVSWWLATQMISMVVGNAYDFHGGWNG